MTNNDKRIIIVGNGFDNSVSDNIFREAVNGEISGVDYLFYWEIKNPFIRLLKRIYYYKKTRLYRIFPFFKCFFNKYKAFERIKKQKNNSIIIVNLASQYANLTTKEEIASLKEIGNTLVLFCVDAIDSPQMNYGEITSWFYLFDLVVCDSPDDAIKYNIFYHMDPYPWKKSELPKSAVVNDLFFLGRGKDRALLCRDIKDFLDLSNAICDFTLVDLGGETNDSNSAECYKGIRCLKHKVEYNEILSGISKSNCILELISYGNGSSLRYFESIVFNKKLITNNKDAYKLPYFDSKYMKIIESPSDIDIEWLTKRENVDYGYKGDFSVDQFLNDIRIELDKRGK